MPTINLAHPIIPFLFFLLFGFQQEVSAQHPTRNPKFHKTVLKSFCESCTLPVDYDTGLIEYKEKIATPLDLSKLRANVRTVVETLCSDGRGTLLNAHSDSTRTVFRRTVDLYGGSAFNGIKKLGVCQYDVELVVLAGFWQYRIHSFVMQGSNRRLHAYLEALHSNVRLQTQATFCVIEAIEGVYDTDDTYTAGLIDKLVQGLQAN
jgi:hypothetical protein